jgi:hypothetical protein
MFPRLSRRAGARGLDGWVAPDLLYLGVAIDVFGYDIGKGNQVDRIVRRADECVV